MRNAFWNKANTRQNHLSARTRKRNALGSSIAEFGPILFIFFLIILFPLIDLIAVAWGYCTCYMATTQAANRASSSNNVDRAQQAIIKVLRKAYQGGFGQFAVVDPVGGLGRSGAHMWVVRTPFAGGPAEYLGPDSSLDPTEVPDPARYVYEYQVTTKQKVGPFIMIPTNMLVDIPGLSSPFEITVTACSVVEHPEGLMDPDRIIMEPSTEEADYPEPALAVITPMSSWRPEPDMPSQW